MVRIAGPGTLEPQYDRDLTSALARRLHDRALLARQTRAVAAPDAVRDIALTVFDEGELP